MKTIALPSIIHTQSSKTGRSGSLCPVPQLRQIAALTRLILLALLVPFHTSRAESERPPRALPAAIASAIPSAIPVAPFATSPKSAGGPAAPPAYRLAPNDIVHIRVFQEDELETSARVSKTGAIPFPLLGTVNIGGYSLQEATSILETSLRSYLTHPQVAIRIVEYSKRKFTILGQVSRPGTYDFPDDSSVSLLEAIGMAGGYTRIANTSKITVKRHAQNGEQVFRIDGKKMAREKESRPFELTPGDTVIIEESLF